jgi:hypothetical protein
VQQRRQLRVPYLDLEVTPELVAISMGEHGGAVRGRAARWLPVQARQGGWLRRRGCVRLCVW